MSSESSDEGETYVIAGGPNGGKSNVLANVLAYQEKEQQNQTILPEQQSNIKSEQSSPFDANSEKPATTHELLYHNAMATEDAKTLARRLTSECAISENLTQLFSPSKDSRKFLLQKYKSFPLLPLARVLTYLSGDSEIVLLSMVPIATEMILLDLYRNKKWVHMVHEESNDTAKQLRSLKDIAISDIFSKHKDLSTEQISNFVNACKNQGISSVADFYALELLIGKKAWKVLGERIFNSDPFAYFLVMKDIAQQAIRSSFGPLISLKEKKRSSSESINRAKTSVSSILPMVQPSVLPIVQPNSSSASNSTGGILSRMFAKAELKASDVPILSQQPGIQIHPSNPNKIIVNTMRGSKVLVDRWCPHKKADMAKGSLQGESIICPKHKWSFDLANGGICREKNVCIGVCALPDW